MKFGHNLPRNQVPEWDGNYINYKGLKKLIKSAAENGRQGDEPDLASFFWSLDRNLEDVGQFYNKKYAEFSRRLKLLEDRYSGISPLAAGGLDRHDVEDLMAALLELRGQFRKLQWYGEVNRRGFIKITKKLDKKVAVAHAQKKYLASKVDPAPFSDANPLLDIMKRINDWLSILSDLGPAVDEDARSTLSVRRVTSRTEIDLPIQDFQHLEEHIRQDKAEELLTSLDKCIGMLGEVKESSLQQFMRDLLQRSILAQARSCIAGLLKRITTLDDHDDINKRNCIHRLVIAIGRMQNAAESEKDNESVRSGEADYINPAEAPILPLQRPVMKEEDQPASLNRNDPLVSLLEYLLDNLHHQQRLALLAKDLSGRTPLHFGAYYGLKDVCNIIIEHLQSWNIFNIDQGIDGRNWQDDDGWAPLHLSVINGHTSTTKALLDAEKTNLSPRNKIRRQTDKSSHVLALAVKENFVEIVRLLVNAGVDINYQDEQGETALHVAARFGHVDCARILLNGTSSQTADTEIPEKTYGWTPLFIASVDGNPGIVELLIESKAELERFDLSGWTAKEHAALRGHMDIARRLSEVTAVYAEPSGATNGLQQSQIAPSSTSLLDRRSNGFGTNGGSTKATEPVKSFGHRYLTDESIVLVSLGTMDMRKALPAVSLERIARANAHTTQLDTALSIVVSASAAKGEPEIIDLPVQDSIATEPIVFYAKDASKVKLMFDLVPTYAGSKDQILGRAVAMLSSVKPSIGSKRITLQGDSTIPIIAAQTLDIIGTLTFNFLVITPFHHPGIKLTSEQTYWKETSTMVIGHRGLGKNVAGRKSLQLGENTIQSFIAAANLGASYVEFDIQLTKDHVPVIYHDFLVSETGIDAPVHTLTLEQFLHVNETSSRTPRTSRPSSPMQAADPRVSDLRGTEKPRHRSLSVGGPGSEYFGFDMSEKMKHTRDFKKKGFKGNSRGGSIQAPFATLAEMFTKVPKDVGFNMEMKYPMLHESEDEEMDAYAVELNSFVDTVLQTVYELADGRNMIFSSFNPDVCLMLSFKQPSIPVLFLTDSGCQHVGDVRASSLQEAIRFASRWNLLGVVTTAEPLVISPRLVKVVKESGLVCVSYGTLNNQPDKVELQVKEGIDAVIVDSVLAIRKGLTRKKGPSTGSGEEKIVEGEETSGSIQKVEINGVSVPVVQVNGTTTA